MCLFVFVVYYTYNRKTNFTHLLCNGLSIACTFRMSPFFNKVMCRTKENNQKKGEKEKSYTAHSVRNIVPYIKIIALYSRVIVRTQRIFCGLYETKKKEISRYKSTYTITLTIKTTKRIIKKNRNRFLNSFFFFISNQK